jgi:hypothetical protein
MKILVENLIIILKKKKKKKRKRRKKEEEKRRKENYTLPQITKICNVLLSPSFQFWY